MIGAVLRTNKNIVNEEAKFKPSINKNSEKMAA
jgi:hypothetical protein